MIGMGCMTTQMIAEAKVPYDKATQGPKNKPQFLIHDEKPPKNEVMKDRGGGFDESQPSNHTNNVRNDAADNDPMAVTELTDLLMPWEISNKDQKNYVAAPTAGTAPSGNPN